MKILNLELADDANRAVCATFSWQTDDGDIEFMGWKILKSGDGLLRVVPPRERIWISMAPPQYRSTVKLSLAIKERLDVLALAEYERAQESGE